MTFEVYKASDFRTPHRNSLEINTIDELKELYLSCKEESERDFEGLIVEFDIPNWRDGGTYNKITVYDDYIC